MYQMAGGPMPSPGTANEIIYLRANWTDAQIATQIASLYNSTVLYQVISGLTSAMIKSGLAAGNGIYDCCNLFGTLSTSTADTTVRNVMRDLYGNKTDQKSILVDNANKTYLLGLCSSHDWSNFVDNSLGLYYQNMALALTDINYNLSSYLSKVQAAIGKSSFTTMLSGLDLTITNEWVAEEHFMYGSSRLGVYRSNKILSKETFGVVAVDGYGNITEKNRLDSFVYVLRTDSFTRVLTQKNYELTNHLGNVLAVISDRRTPHQNVNNIDYYEADVTSATLYYPFGMELKTYAADSNGYRFGFNGMEKDDDIKGSGNSLDFGARIYDSRLGRWLALDPLMNKYPGWSAYNFAANNPLYFIDGDGRDIIPTNWFILYNQGFEMVQNIVNEIDKNSVFYKYLGGYMGSEKNLHLSMEHREPNIVATVPMAASDNKNKAVKFNPNAIVKLAEEQDPKRDSDEITYNILTPAARAANFVHEVIFHAASFSSDEPRNTNLVIDAIESLKEVYSMGNSGKLKDREAVILILKGIQLDAKSSTDIEFVAQINKKYGLELTIEEIISEGYKLTYTTENLTPDEADEKKYPDSAYNEVGDQKAEPLKKISKKTDTTTTKKDEKK